MLRVGQEGNCDIVLCFRSVHVLIMLYIDKIPLIDALTHSLLLRDRLLSEKHQLRSTLDAAHLPLLDTRIQAEDEIDEKREDDGERDVKWLNESTSRLREKEKELKEREKDVISREQWVLEEMRYAQPPATDN